MTSLGEILALARSGSPDRAWTAFVAAGWDRRDGDPDALTLKGRLLKDQAKRAALADRPVLYRKAGAAYAAAAALAPATYPLINAATLALLGGEPAEANALASRVLDLIDRGVHQPETPYWIEATRAEALLLLGRRDAARDALQAAIARAPGAWEDHAATIGQFALILGARQTDAAWLDRHRPPASLYFHGIMGIAPDDAEAAARIDAMVGADPPGFVFGALAAGADILIAEAALRRSALLHVVLPCTAAEFRAASVTAIGDRWGARFDALIDAADAIERIDGDHALSPAAITIANRMAMGLAIRNARLLQSRAVALAVAARTDPAGPDPAWEEAGGLRRVLAIDRSAATPSEAGERGSEAVAIVIVAEADAKAAEPIGARWRERMGDHALIALDTPERALAVAKMLARNAAIAPALGLDYGLATNGRIDPTLAARAITIASAASAGQWLASRPMALALELANPRPAIEIGGEVRGPSGVHPLFAIGPR